jgi:hypothetical protein
MEDTGLLRFAIFPPLLTHHNALLSIFMSQDTQAGASMACNIALRALSSKGQIIFK